MSRSRSESASQPSFVFDLNCQGILFAVTGHVAQVKSDAWAGKYKFVYLTPELAVMSASRLTKLHQTQDGIGLIAIDEAHCVSGTHLPAVCLWWS